MIYKASFFRKPVTLSALRDRVELFKKIHYQYPSEIVLKGKDYDQYVALIPFFKGPLATYRNIPVRRYPPS